MRAALLVGLVACGTAAATDVPPDAPPPPPPDAAPPPPDAAAEDLDLTVHDLVDLQLMKPAGRNYRVANPLGHEAEALAVAASPTGGPWPVGSIVEIQPSEVMVKRRDGFDAVTADWEFFAVSLAADGTPLVFTVRGTEDTACFTCHAMMSSAQWGFICEHP